MMRYLSMCAAACVAFASAGCGNIFGYGDEHDLKQAERQWSRQGPLDYSYVLRRSCFCLTEITREVRIVVENRIVTSRQYVDTGEDVPEQFRESFPAMEGVFRIVHDALDQDAHRLDAWYDARLGHPITVSIDYVRDAVDDEIVITVSEVRER